MGSAPGESDELTDRFTSGGEAALSKLFAEHRDRLWRMVNFRMDRRLLARVDADDVLQEAYLAAAARLEHYQSGSSPFVWLRMIVMQTLIDVHRHHLGAQMRDADREVGLPGCRYPQSTTASLAAQFVGRFTSPSQAAARAEMFGKVQDAIATMEALDQEILALRHFEELSNGEVAEVLGIQQKAASIRYVRAIKRLRVALAQVPGFFEGDQDV
ncbi:MAG: sigma-70 family RNA polymerase sigma factor [Pirellulales bacterium]